MKIEDVYSDLPVIETNRLLLRKLTLSDVDDMYEYASNEDVSKYVVWPTHQSKEDSAAFIQYVLSLYDEGKLSPWAIEYKATQKMIGTIDFVMWNVNHKTAEIGYCISKEYWGQGITTEAAKELIKFGFNNMGLVRIQARCHVDNIGSSRVMEKIGMSFEGILRKELFIKGKHWDVKMYSILDDEYFNRLG